MPLQCLCIPMYARIHLLVEITRDVSWGIHGLLSRAQVTVMGWRGGCSETFSVAEGWGSSDETENKPVSKCPASRLLPLKKQTCQFFFRGEGGWLDTAYRKPGGRQTVRLMRPWSCDVGKFWKKVVYLVLVRL